MSFYQIALLVHVLGSFGLCAALAIEGPVLFQLRRNQTVEQARGVLSIYSILKWLGRASLVALLAGGFYMASVAWRDAAWATVAFGSVILYGLIGALATGVRMRKLTKALKADGSALQQALAPIRQPMLVVSLWVRISIVVSVAALMVFKPSLGPSVLVVLITITVGAVTGTIAASKRSTNLQTLEASRHV